MYLFSERKILVLRETMQVFQIKIKKKKILTHDPMRQQ